MGTIATHIEVESNEVITEPDAPRSGFLGARTPIALFVLLSLAISVPIIVLTVYVATSSTRLAITDAIATNSSAVRLASRTLSERISTARSVIDSIDRGSAVDPALARAVFDAVPGAHALIQLDADDGVTGSWDGDGRTSLQGLGLSRTDVRRALSAVGFRPPGQDGEASLVGRPIEGVGGELLIAIPGTPLRDAVDHVQARLAILVRSTSLLPLLEGGRLKEGGYVYIVDEEGTVISHPIASRSSTRASIGSSAILADALSGVPSSGRAADPIDGTDAIMAATRIPGTTWIAVSRQSVDVALKGAREQAGGATGIALFLLLLSIIFSAMVATLWARSHRLNDELTASLSRERAIADALQENLLTKLPELDALDMGVKHVSATEGALVGGDFYDVVALDDDRTAIFIGDVCGKGVGTAVQTAVTRGLIRGLLPTTRSPAELLSKVNQRLGNLSGTFSNPETFVTIIIGIYDRRSGEFRFSQAGHPSPIISSRNSNHYLPHLDGVPLGILPDSGYAESAVRLDDGDTLLFFTDGLIETRGPEGMLGEEKVLRTFARLAKLHPKDVAMGVFDMAYRFSGGNLTDDVAVLALRRPHATRPDLPRPASSSRLDSAES